jgi:hypothetical protein
MDLSLLSVPNASEIISQNLNFHTITSNIANYEQNILDFLQCFEETAQTMRYLSKSVKNRLVL